jgi:hypothetical protein
MKKIGMPLGVLLCLLASSSAYAQPRDKKVRLIYQPDAVLHLCLGLLGCADRVSIDDQEVLLEPLGFAEQEVQDIKACLSGSGVADVGPGQVVGFIVKEEGHFPNPTVKVKVFKMLDTGIPPPCS